ncbi:MAG: 50S ribosomal protein L29 [Patescibacteria group bacterium]|nr:50S ribosomal protein L29 [Patescibacteria group bacterium]
MDFKTATIEEIKKFADDRREELRLARFSSSGSKSRNVKLARELRHEIARALTELSLRNKA